MDIPPALLAAADREKCQSDEILDGCVRDAVRYLKEHSDPVLAYSRVKLSLHNAGAPHPADGVMAAAAVRLAQADVRR